MILKANMVKAIDRMSADCDIRQELFKDDKTLHLDNQQCSKILKDYKRDLLL